MSDKIRISRFLENRNPFYILESAILSGIPLYAYTAPMRCKKPKMKIQRTVAGPRKEFLVSLESLEELESCNDFQFYEINESTLHLVIINQIFQFGSTIGTRTQFFKDLQSLNSNESKTRDDNNEDVSLDFTPHLDIIKSSPTKGRSDEMLVFYGLYNIHDLYINKDDIGRFENLADTNRPQISPTTEEEHFLTTKAKPELNQNSEQKNHLNYPDTKAGENLKTTHEAIIDHLICLIEKDFKNDALKANSEIKTLLTLEGKFVNSKLANSLTDMDTYYFDNDNGFGSEAIRKRITEIRKKFTKIPKI